MSYKVEVDGRTLDALRWVAQEARGAIMIQDLNKGRLREALEQLRLVYGLLDLFVPGEQASEAPDPRDDDQDDLSGIPLGDLLHQIRALYGAIGRQPDAHQAARELARGIEALDKALTLGDVLPRPWQRSAAKTLAGG